MKLGEEVWGGRGEQRRIKRWAWVCLIVCSCESLKTRAEYLSELRETTLLTLDDLLF